jgi:hypothetical protein
MFQNLRRVCRIAVIICDCGNTITHKTPVRLRANPLLFLLIVSIASVSSASANRSPCNFKCFSRKFHCDFDFDPLTIEKCKIFVSHPGYQMDHPQTVLELNFCDKDFFLNIRANPLRKMLLGEIPAICSSRTFVSSDMPVP